MSCSVNRNTLREFYYNNIVSCLNSQQEVLFLKCIQRCKEIIEEYKRPFPCDCAQLEFLLWLMRHNLISTRNFFAAMGEVVNHMYNHFDEIYKSPKIFISHSTNDKLIVGKFVTMLERMGVKQNQLFCSSIPGYGIPQGAGDLYDFIRNEISNDNLFFIIMLSKNYYSSPVCLNEMGAAWVKQSTYQGILLPDFQYEDIKGSINPRDISFKIDDKERRNGALNELKRRIVAHLGMADVDHTIWERFRDEFTNEVDQIALAYSRSEKT